ncbi:hypothetical protein C8Q73DRAFT_706859 [Cubamyces lactineus]|nr:hypothetical protein C8Q73DRAFT_706859 [Cubamyces lactineus]
MFFDSCREMDRWTAGGDWGRTESCMRDVGCSNCESSLRRRRNNQHSHKRHDHERVKKEIRVSPYEAP